MKNRSIPLTPYKGARDFYPQDMEAHQFWKEVLSTAVSQFGYEPYDGPMLERVELYQAKTSDEIVSEQTYAFEDRGGRHVVIRPEMTPTFARMVAAKAGSLSFPLRWFAIPNLWRYERPQKGRLREHWQLNCDLVAPEITSAYELEMIRMLKHIMTAFGAQEDQFQLKLNHRGLCDRLFEVQFGLTSPEDRGTLFYILDRLDKFSYEGLSELAQSKGLQVFEEAYAFFKETKEPEGFFKSVSNDSLYASFIEVYKNAEKCGNFVCFDPTVVRGFQYYTGLVFEMVDTDPDNPRALLGGGRYDRLISAFSPQKLQGIGFGLGDVTFQAFLKGHELETKRKSEPLWGVLASDEVMPYASMVQDRLVAKGVRTTACFQPDRVLFKSGLKTILKSNPDYLAIVGSKEQESQTVVIKNTKTREERIVKVAELESVVEIRSTKFL